MPGSGTDASVCQYDRLKEDERTVGILGCAGLLGIDQWSDDLKIAHPQSRQFGQRVVDAVDGVLGRLKMVLDLCGQSHQFDNAQGKQIVHGIFLGVNGGQYQEAAQGICPFSGRNLARAGTVCALGVGLPSAPALATKAGKAGRCAGSGSEQFL